MITRKWNEKTDYGYLGHLFTNGTLKVSTSLTQILGRCNLSQRDFNSDLSVDPSNAAQIAAAQAATALSQQAANGNTQGNATLSVEGGMRELTIVI